MMLGIIVMPKATKSFDAILFTVPSSGCARLIIEPVVQRPTQVVNASLTVRSSAAGPEPGSARCGILPVRSSDSDSVTRSGGPMGVAHRAARAFQTVHPRCSRNYTVLIHSFPAMMTPLIMCDDFAPCCTARRPVTGCVEEKGCSATPTFHGLQRFGGFPV